MEYKDFKHEFVERTLHLMQEYGAEYEATLLLNCLLGLIVLPHESMESQIPDEPIANLEEWGIPLSAIRKFERCPCNDNYPKTVRQFVECLRNAVAHFDVTPRHENRSVAGFIFKGRHGFSADICLDDLRKFVTRLSERAGGGQPRE